MTKKQKVLAIIGASSAALIAVGGSALALFTDNASKATNGTAGTVDILASDIELSNFDNINPGDNDPDMPKSYIPTVGDPLFDASNPNKEVALKTTEHDLTFSITNEGTKSIRTRHTFVLSVKDGSGNFLDARVFQLYEDGNELTGKVYIDSKGKEYTSLSAIPNDVLIQSVRYRFTPDIFDGIGKGAEVETVSTVKSVGGKAATQDYLYELALDKETPNEYQGASLSIEAMFEALQFRNTNQNDWNVVSTDTFTATVAGSTTSAAPGR